MCGIPSALVVVHSELEQLSDVDIATIERKCNGKLEGCPTHKY